MSVFSGSKEFLNNPRLTTGRSLRTFPVETMTEGDPQKLDSTESLIETLHATRRSKTLVINPDYLDDERLPEEERTAVLKEIFNRKIREKQISRIISHLTQFWIVPILHQPLFLVPQDQGKRVTLIHVLSTFQTGS